MLVQDNAASVAICQQGMENFVIVALFNVYVFLSAFTAFESCIKPGATTKVKILLLDCKMTISRNFYQLTLPSHIDEPQMEAIVQEQSNTNPQIVIVLFAPSIYQTYDHNDWLR